MSEYWQRFSSKFWVKFCNFISLTHHSCQKICNFAQKVEGEVGLLLEYYWTPIEQYRTLFYILAFFSFYKSPKQKLLKDSSWRLSTLNYFHKGLHLRCCRKSGFTSFYNIWQNNFSLSASNCYLVHFNCDLWK